MANIQEINDPVTNISNVESISGWGYVSGMPTWDVDASNRNSKNAYNTKTGDFWMWEEDKVAVGNGAWVLKNMIAKVVGNGVPTYVPASDNEIAINSRGELYRWDSVNLKWKAVIMGINDFSFDAAGNYRVSQSTTLLDGKTIGSDDTFLFENVGTGTAAYTANKLRLATVNQYMIRQSRRFYPYFAGKSQLIECTFDEFHTQTNVTKRVGYYSSAAVAPYTASFDGFFVEDNGTIKTLQVWRGGILTISIPFTTMDDYATISTVDWSRFNVIAFDFWLGGVLRFFVKVADGFKLIHTFSYAGTAADTMTLSPNQPLRYEIRGTGTGSLRYICSQVSTDGSVNESGKSLSIFNQTGLTCNTVGTIYALKSVRKQAAFRDVAIRVNAVSISIGTANDQGIMMLLLNPTLSAAITYVNKDKIQEGTATNQTITAGSGRLLWASPVATTNGNTGALDQNYLSILGGTILDVMDQYVLAYMPTINNQTVHGIISIEEM